MTIKELMEEVWRERACQWPSSICRWIIGGKNQDTHIVSRKGRHYEVPKRTTPKKRHR